MVPSRVIGGLTQSPSTSGIFFQGDGQSYVNSSSSIPGTGRSNLGPVSGDIHNGVLNSVANSGPSVGASSLVTDANSSLSGGPRLQRSQSTNNESYLCLPASPMSFTSNNISISGSSVMDGSTVVQQSSHHDQNTQLQQNQQGGSTATSLPTGGRLPGSYLHDPNNLSQKKPRLDLKQDDILPQQVLQQLFQRQDSMRNPQIQALFQQQRLRQQQQILQSMPQLQRAHMQQQQQQQQQMLMRQQMQQQALQPPASLKRPYDGGVCARRLMQYLYHQRQRPSDNAIAYWRKFVAEYYSPRAKKRWCLSLYENVGHQALGVFPQAAMDAWQCDLCGSKSGRGFEATSEVLPRLNEIKFGSGVIDELLFVDLPREYRYPSGVMVLEYAKAVQESVYEQLRVVREGQLRIIFTQDLKILNWEFCARRHEELFPRRSVAPQVNQLVQVAQKCQTTIAESGADGISQQDLQTNSTMVLNAGRQLSKSLELQSLNDLGFSKRYVRCLQISEVVNSMKDLIDFCREHKAGPIDGLKSYPRHSSAAKLQMQKMQEMEQMASAQGMPTDRNTLNKLMSLHPNQLNNANANHNNHNNMVNNSRGALSGSAQAALALSTYQNMLMKQNSTVSLHHQEASSSFPTPNQNPSSSYSPHHHQQQPQPPHQQQPPPPHQQQQRSMSGPANMLQQSHHPQTPQGSASPTMHHQMIQQLLQEMSNGNGPRNGMNFGGNTPAPAPANSGGPAPSRSNSFKAAAAASNSDSAGGFNQNLQDDIIPDIPSDFNDSSFFGSDLDDPMEYGWKA